MPKPMLPALAVLLHPLASLTASAVAGVAAAAALEPPLPTGGSDVREMLEPDRERAIALLRTCCYAGAKLADVSRAVAELRDGHLLTDPDDYRNAIYQAGKRRAWQEALTLWDEMNWIGQPIDSLDFKGAIFAAGLGGNWELALALLREHQSRQLPASLPVYNALLLALKETACEVPGLWELSFALLEEMVGEYVSPDAPEYNVVVATCSRARQLEPARRVISEMRYLSIFPDKLTYTSLISACGWAGEWKEALEILLEMRFRGSVKREVNVKPDFKAYTAAMVACAKSSQVETVLELLSDLRRGKPNTRAFNAAMTACLRAGQWETVFEIEATMRKCGNRMGLITYNNLLTACALGAKWEWALDLLDEMRGAWRPTKPGEVAFMHAIAACEAAEKAEAAEGLRQEMRRQGLGVEPMDDGDTSREE